MHLIAELTVDLVTLLSMSFQVNAVVDDDDNVTLFAPAPNEECRKLRDMCYLATAYSANLGGTAVLTATSPNLLMKASMEKYELCKLVKYVLRQIS